ncbi:mycofactocin precursor MftA [Streptomyces varsoviensis]|uniref:mycofactocin precursor MftA n=1 Tax=Streptomyces varsoviensis TaxID=67373 RepID=UPI0007C5C965|nr:mycofactocin precursor MftA [Streptomyces varsoviensis]
MAESPTSPTPDGAAEESGPPREPTGNAPDVPEGPAVLEVLVEEVSIDGMCGVY